MINKLLEAKVKSIDSENGTFEVIASSGKVDRLGDTIDPKGWYLKNYKKNPVMLWSHSTGGMFGGTAIPPVAKATKIWVDDDKELKLKGQWADTPFAQELKTLVEGGFLNAVSVGFLPLVEDKKGDIEMESKMYRRATEKETSKGIYDNEYGESFTKQELLEVSWVSVPALPQALISAKEMKLGLITKALESEIKQIPEDEPESETDEKTEDVSLEKRISQLEKVISSLTEIKNPKDATPKVDTKGRNSFVKQKSKKSETERLLIMFDKMIETLLRKLRQ